MTLPAPHSSPAAPQLRRCPPRSSQPHLGYTSPPAPQLTSSTQLHVAARPAAHSRISATRRCPPRSSQPHLGFTTSLPAPEVTAASWLHLAARPAALPECYGRSCASCGFLLFSFMFAFLCSGDCGVMAFSAASPAPCHSLSCACLRH